MLIKSAPVQVKAVNEDEGTFEAIVAVFGNKDRGGDIILPGAFAESLQKWAESGDSIPVYWSHRMDDPDYNIGWVIEAKETDAGLWVKVQIDLEATTSKAPQVYRLLKGRRVKQFSFAYDIVEGAFVDADDDHWYELRKLDIHEVGPTPIGMNPETELLAVKSTAQQLEVAAASQVAAIAAAAKAGRAISAKNEKALRTALESIEGSAEQIKNVLGALDASDDEASKDDEAKSSEPAKDEETPDGSKSEEPMRAYSAEMSELLNIQLADAS